MPTSERESYRVAVLTGNEGEVARAKEILSELSSGEVNVYDGVVTGWATTAAIRSIRQAGMVVERSSRETLVEAAQTRSTRESQAGMGKLRRLAKAIPALEELTRGSVSAVTSTEVAPKALPVSHFVSFRGPMRSVWGEELRACGLKYESKVDDDTYRMLLDPEQLNSVREFEFVVSVELEPARVTEGVADKWEKLESEIPLPGLLGEDTHPVLKQMYDVVLHRPEDVEDVARILALLELVQVLDRGSDRVRILAPANAPALAAIPIMPQVRLLADYESPTLFCNEAPVTIGLRPDTTPAPAWFPWTGKGVKVGVFDSGADDTHPDLTSVIAKLSVYRDAISKDTIGHGTHVAGLIAGRGIQSGGRMRGVAPDAELFVTSMVTSTANLILPPDYQDLFGGTLQDGVQVINLSWGTPISGDYDQGSVQIDLLAYQNPEVLFVIAAGNSGIALDGQHKFKTVGTPGSAKNALTVGAHGVTCADNTCQNHVLTWGQFRPQKFPKAPAANEVRCPVSPGTVSAFSSRGPTDFDSIKPDLLAPGVLIESVRSQHASPLSKLFDSGCPVLDSQFYVCCSGTSMAAPVVSGAAAVIIEYLRDMRATLRPSAALVKALLLAATRPVSQPSPERGAFNSGIGFPDFDQGFGLLNLSELLPHPGSALGRHIEFADVANDSPLALASRQPIDAARKSKRLYRFDVAGSAHESLTVVLCWTDWPGSGIQNNIDLLLRTPSSVLVGNHAHKFRKDPLFDDTGDGGCVLDKHNNVELVRIDRPEAGSYELQVIANNTSQPFSEPRQGYALVVVGEISGFVTLP